MQGSGVTQPVKFLTNETPLSMTSTFQCEYCQCFKFKGSDKLKTKMYQSWRYVQCALFWKNQHNLKTVNVETQIFDMFGATLAQDNIFQKNLANVFLIVIPSRNISSAIYLAQKSSFKVLNLPLTRTSAINASILPIT